MDKETSINSFFDKIYVINLKKRPDRLMKLLVRTYNLGIKVEVMEAVDGSMSPYINNYKKYVYNSKFIFNNLSQGKRIPNYGAWGYLLSWKMVLEDAKGKGYKNFLCFDDDVIFQRNFGKKFVNFSRYLPANWKIINLGSSQHTSFQVLDQTLIKFNDGLPYYHPSLTDGSFATAVHHSIYDELLELIAPMDYAFDSGALRAIYKKYPKQCFVAHPNLIIADVTDSTIRDPRDQEVMARKVGWRLELFRDYSLPLVSVIISAYNSEDTIEMSIKSIQLQTYKNIEIIVVDDCSTDSTAKIVCKLIELDESERLTLVQNPENLGCYGSRNAGIRESKGRFITFHDADDYSLSTRIQDQLIALMRYDVLFTTCLIMRSHLPNFDFLSNGNKNSDKYLINNVRKYRKHIKKDGSGNYEYCCKAILGMVTTLFRREVFEKLGLYWELRCIADAEYCERVLFNYNNKLFRDNESVVSYLSKTDYIPKIYYKVNNVLYISKEMNSANITNKYKGKVKLLEQLRRNWRLKLENKFTYMYPMLLS